MKAQRTAGQKNAEHLDFVRSLPCCACLKPGRSEAHHESELAPEENGMGKKVSDKWVVPFCGKDHRRRHDKGVHTFWGDTDIALRLVNVLWRHSGDMERGRRAVFRCFQELSQRMNLNKGG